MQLISHLIVKSIAALIKFHWVSTTWHQVQAMMGSTESSATPDLSVTQLWWNVSDEAGAELSRPLYAIIGFGNILKSKQNHQKKRKTRRIYDCEALQSVPPVSEWEVIAGVKIAFAPLDGASKLVSATSPQIHGDNSPDCVIAGGKITRLSSKIYLNTGIFMRSQISSDPPSKREMQEEYSSSFTAHPLPLCGRFTFLWALN